MLIALFFFSSNEGNECDLSKIKVFRLENCDSLVVFELQLCIIVSLDASKIFLIFLVRAVFIMVRKKRAEVPGGGESSETQGSGGSGRGSQRPVDRSAQAQQLGGGGGSQGGRGWVPQGGRGGYGGGRGRGSPQQHHGGPPDYQGRGRGGPFQQGGRGGYSGGRGGGGTSGGRGPSYGVSSQPEVPELHQATPVSYHAGVTPQSAVSEASSSSQLPETSQLEQQIGQMTIQSESASAPPASSKSVRFPLRPGKGSYGTKCIVKANHFFAELPNKDLHQYDVSAAFLNFLKFLVLFILLFTDMLHFMRVGNHYSRSDIKRCKPCCYEAAG